MHSVRFCEEFQDFRAGATVTCSFLYLLICYALQKTHLGVCRVQLVKKNRLTQANMQQQTNAYLNGPKLGSVDGNIMNKICFSIHHRNGS